MNTYPLLVWVNISNAKVILLKKVEMVADEVKQVLSLGIPLKETEHDNLRIMCLLLKGKQQLYSFSQEFAATSFCPTQYLHIHRQLMNTQQMNDAYMRTSCLGKTASNVTLSNELPNDIWKHVDSVISKHCFSILIKESIFWELRSQNGHQKVF